MMDCFYRLFKVCWLMLLIGAGLVAAGFASHSYSKEVITIATGEKDGMYHQFGLLLKQQLEQNSGVKVKVLSTQGSGENIKLLNNHEVNFVVAQTGVADFTQLQVITPLFIEPVLVLAPQDLAIDSLSQLSQLSLVDGGHQIDLGPVGSGSRITGARILKHYNMPLPDLSAKSQLPSITLPSISLEVTALLNQSINRLVAEQKLKLLAIDDAEAIAIKYPHLQAVEVPKGMFSSAPAVPESSLPTVAATAVLLAGANTDPEVIELVLNGIYRSELKTKFPVLMTPKEVRAWSLFPYKPVSINFLDPYSGLGLYAKFAESLVAVKELIFALMGICYFGWLRYKNWLKKQRQAELSALKEQLDVFVEETARIERLYMEKSLQAEVPIAELKQLLQQVIDNKLTALAQLTDEKLRGDNLFAIFIAQSNNLVTRIEHKIDNRQ